MSVLRKQIEDLDAASAEVSSAFDRVFEEAVVLRLERGKPSARVVATEVDGAPVLKYYGMDRAALATIRKHAEAGARHASVPIRRPSDEEMQTYIDETLPALVSMERRPKLPSGK